MMHHNPGEASLKAIPVYGRALLNALRFDGARPNALGQLSQDEWQRLFASTDASQVTLLLGHLSGEFMPSFARERIARNYQDNLLRFTKLKTDLKAICQELNSAGIEFTILKGLSHAPYFTADPVLRSQGDIDIWCQPARVEEAQGVLRRMGYRSIGKSKGRHLDPMIREFSWNWTGNYYNPDLPIPVDLHYRLWDAEMEHIPGPAETEIWQRRCRLIIDDLPIAFQLSLVDTFAFATLHFLNHLLHGDVRLQRAWELAYFVGQNQNNADFWSEWQRYYRPELRQAQLIPIALSQAWFGCQVPVQIQEEIQTLPRDVLTWLEHYSFSTLKALFTPSVARKDELWLNLALLSARRAKLAVFVRRILPVGAAASQTSQEVQYTKGNPFRVIHFIIRRAMYHVSALPLILMQAVRWFWVRQRVGIAKH